MKWLEHGLLYLLYRQTIISDICLQHLFRFFDILKPLGIKQAEKLPSGYGIMADDILSGIYGGIVILLYRFVCA